VLNYALCHADIMASRGTTPRTFLTGETD